MIVYLKHEQIDKEKWDSCIEKSTNGLVYALSWYLNIVCENWDALILGDYKAVMPLPWKKKYGLKYIYHPFFAQQLGIFYQETANIKLALFLRKIPITFIKYDFSINSAVNCNKVKHKQRLNLILPLNASYEYLHKQFNTNTKRNIKKHINSDWKLKNNIDVPSFIQLIKENWIHELKQNNLEILEALFNKLIEKNKAKIVGITDSKQKLISAAIFLLYNNRIIYLYSASANTGKDKSSMFKIINAIIKDNAKTNQILDFEGSMIPGVARFFKGFGVNNEYYYNVSHSRIPFL